MQQAALLLLDSDLDSSGGGDDEGSADGAAATTLSTGAAGTFAASGQAGDAAAAAGTSQGVNMSSCLTARSAVKQTPSASVATGNDPESAADIEVAGRHLKQHTSTHFS